MTPTEQIEKRLKDLTSDNLEARQLFENKFRGFKEHLEKRVDLKPSADRTLSTPFALFFSRNGLPLARAITHLNVRCSVQNSLCNEGFAGALDDGLKGERVNGK